MAESTFVVVWENVQTGEFLEHQNGVPWHDVRRPRRWHKCYAQTRGFRLSEVYGPALISRCPCGGVEFEESGLWIERNCRVL